MNAVAAKNVMIDASAETLRPEHKRQAQEWAGIKQDLHSDLFVWVCLKQKGANLMAGILPGLCVTFTLSMHLFSSSLRLEEESYHSVIVVELVINLYNRFGANELARLMEVCLEPVYSKPELTAFPVRLCTCSAVPTVQPD